jgi:hypothetical protein
MNTRLPPSSSVPGVWYKPKPSASPENRVQRERFAYFHPALQPIMRRVNVDLHYNCRAQSVSAIWPRPLRFHKRPTRAARGCWMSWHLLSVKVATKVYASRYRQVHFKSILRVLVSQNLPMPTTYVDYGDCDDDDDGNTPWRIRTIICRKLSVPYVALYKDQWNTGCLLFTTSALNAYSRVHDRMTLNDYN